MSKAFDNIKDRIDTKEERKKLRAEHGWWALFVIVLTLIPLAYWSELPHLSGFAAFTRTANPIIGLGVIIFVIYNDHPKWDWLKIAVVVLCAFFTIYTMATASQYRQDKLQGIEYDKRN